MPGVTTDELDRIGHEFLCDHGAYPSTLGYRGFPKSLCSSVNEVICHGIPDSRVVEDGDIVNIDITAFIDGVHGDTNATFLAGDVDEESRLLVERTKESLDRAIKAVQAGARVNIIGRVIEAYAKRFGYGVVRDFTGHGIGTAFHSGLIIPHYDDQRFDDEIRVGMTFTIEPMLNLGTRRLRHVGRRLDRRDQGPPPVRAVRAHPARHRGWRRGAHPPLDSAPSGSAGRPRSVTSDSSAVGSRKVRAPQGRVVANSHPGKPAGSVPQRTDRLPACRAVRVKRWCKRPPVRRATGAARQTPPGARSDRMRSRAARPSIRVDRTRRPATVVADGWSPLLRQDRTRPTGRPTPYRPLTCGNVITTPL